jgi:hypothetical protein
VTESHRIATAAHGKELQFMLQGDVQGGLGEYIITGGPRPWPWHPRALYQWGKYWVTRPFRGR